MTEPTEFREFTNEEVESAAKESVELIKKTLEIGEPTELQRAQWLEQNAKDIGGDMFQPNGELQKAIEAFEHYRMFPLTGDRPTHVQYDLVTSAAKQLQAVAKERDEAQREFLNRGILIGQIQEELSTLKSDYKQALEVLDKHKWVQLRLTILDWEELRVKVLSLPSAIEIMKGDKV